MSLNQALVFYLRVKIEEKGRDAWQVISGYNQRNLVENTMFRLKTIFGGKLKARDIEKKSQDFYTEKANEVTEAYQIELFLKLAVEEKKHYFLLDNILDFISRPEQWLENAEFFRLEDS